MTGENRRALEELQSKPLGRGINKQSLPHKKIVTPDPITFFHTVIPHTGISNMIPYGKLTIFFFNL